MSTCSSLSRCGPCHVRQVPCRCRAPNHVLTSLSPFPQRLATMECLPSFETTGGLVDAFPRDMLTAEDISQKRITMREVLEGYADTAAAP
mgnify:CR=1 FL=1